MEYRMYEMSDGALVPDGKVLDFEKIEEKDSKVFATSADGEVSEFTKTSEGNFQSKNGELYALYTI